MIDVQFNAAILGSSLRHTLSPAMHTAAFKALGLPFAYGVIDIRPGFLPAVIPALRKKYFRGANITIPHKTAILPLLDRIDDEAAEIGAVNTIVNQKGVLTGYNTDAAGMYRTLEPYHSVLTDRNIFLFGGGGAARAAIHVLLKYFSVKRIFLFNRSPERTRQLIGSLRSDYSKRIEDLSGNREFPHKALELSACVINTTSVGMFPHISESPVPSEILFSNEQIILDIVYNPLETALLQTARRCGTRAIPGIEMFLHQGAKAFELWTGEEFPMREARTVVLKKLETGTQ